MKNKNKKEKANIKEKKVKEKPAAEKKDGPVCYQKRPDYSRYDLCNAAYYQHCIDICCFEKD